MATAIAKFNGFKVVNEFHGYEKMTRSELQVKKLVRESRPANCTSRTQIFRVVDGVILNRVDFDGKQLRDM